MSFIPLSIWNYICTLFICCKLLKRGLLLGCSFRSGANVFTRLVECCHCFFTRMSFCIHMWTTCSKFIHIVVFFLRTYAFQDKNQDNKVRLLIMLQQSSCSLNLWCNTPYRANFYFNIVYLLFLSYLFL